MSATFPPAEWDMETVEREVGWGGRIALAPTQFKLAWKAELAKDLWCGWSVCYIYGWDWQRCPECGRCGACCSGPSECDPLPEPFDCGETS